MASLLSPLTNTSTNTASFVSDRINLIDNTRSPEDQSPIRQEQGDGGDDIIQLSPSKSSSPTLSRRITGTSLRENLARRKYAKYSEERYVPASITERPGTGQRTHTLDSKQSASSKGKERAEDQGDNEEQVSAPPTPLDGSPIKRIKTVESKLRRGHKRVRSFMHWHRHKYKLSEGDIAVEVLYENQRGTFIFGNPLFSSQSLLNFDPPAWTNAYGHASPVDITNAQVPDPTWAWDWTTWYVDMGADVDDQGWQYSFSFAKRFSWHGTHPWFHSFVRRRRWIRRRVRKHHHLPDGRIVDATTRMTVKAAHRMNEDYFTIHPPSRAGMVSPDSSTFPSGSRPITPMTIATNDDDAIDNIQDLLDRVRRSTVDREKIQLVHQFMDEGGEEVHYLADELPHILSLFVFQYTRRQLLTSMLKTLEELEVTSRPPTESGEPEGEEEQQRSLAGLRRAVKAADEQIQQLEYWSDIKDVVRKGETIGGTDGELGWEPEEWAGLDAAGPPHPDHEIAPAPESTREDAE